MRKKVVPVRKPPQPNKKKTPLQEALLRTLAYFQVFDHTPTLEELHQYLICQKASLEDVRLAAKQLGRLLPQSPSPPAGRARAVGEVINKAKKRASLSRFVPGVEAMFLTGDLAAGAVKESSDFDFLVVCRDGWLPVVRIMLQGWYPLLGLRKSRLVPLYLIHELVVKSAEEHPPRAGGGISRFALKLNRRQFVCLNIFLEESALTVPRQMQNLYIANEIARVKPLWDRGDYYRCFLDANAWVLNFLPNAFLPPATRYPPPTVKKQRQLFLHSKDLTSEVLGGYKKNCEKLGITPYPRKFLKNLKV